MIAAPPARIGKTTGSKPVPPVSQAQRGAMRAAAAGNSSVGIPVKVGREFSKADKGGKLPPRVKRGAGRPGLINKTK